jgi:hypothetical protein
VQKVADFARAGAERHPVGSERGDRAERDGAIVARI